MMLRGLFFAGMLLAAGAVCAQDVVISGKDFLSGAGDAKIAELARQAAASGKTLVIAAPPYWQDKASAKAHAGAANAAVRTSDAFFENVTIRLEDAKPQARAAEARQAPRAEPRPEPKVAARVEPKPAPPPRPAVVERAPPPKPARVEPPPEPKPAPVAAPSTASAAAAPPPVQQPARPVAPPPAAAPAPKPAVAAAPPPAAKPAPPPPDPSIAIRKRMEQNLNDGNPAEGSIEVAQLQKNDMLFVDGPVRGVVRRFGPRTHLYWLQGELNLERAELVPTGNDRYRVEEPVRNVANPSLRGGSRGKALMFTANVPAPGSKARQEIEGRYNDGRAIDASVQPADLRQGDLVYTNQGSAVVVRRTSVGIERYWLVGQMDLHQTGLQSQGNAIRVLTDTVR